MVRPIFPDWIWWLRGVLLDRRSCCVDIAIGGCRMFTIIGVLACTFSVVKTIEMISDYYVTKDSEAKWAEFMILWNRLKAEERDRLNTKERSKLIDADQRRT